jgi:hypothetical protein
MKRLMIILAVESIVFTTLFGFQSIESSMFSQFQIDRMEKQISVTLGSSIPQQQIDGAMLLHRMIELNPSYEWSRCIIPLMQVLNKETNDPAARVLAAMVLHELRSERGDFAISRNAQFTDDARVKRYCMILSRVRLLEKSKS